MREAKWYFFVTFQLWKTFIIASKDLIIPCASHHDGCETKWQCHPQSGLENMSSRPYEA
jgi:hypothetical protein